MDHGAERAQAQQPIRLCAQDGARSNQSVHDAATQMLADEVKYFAEKKKEEKEAEKKAKNETRKGAGSFFANLNGFAPEAKSCYAEGGEFRIALAVCRRVPCPSAARSDSFS
jgi:hypothetical protein